MKEGRWYRVRTRRVAESIYYVQAAGPADAKDRIRNGTDYVEGRAAWSGFEAVPDEPERVVGRAEPVDELPEWAREELIPS